MTRDDQRREEVFRELKSLLTDILKIMREKDVTKRPEINWETDLEKDLGVDSLETLDILNAIEDRFNVNPQIHEANSMRKVREVVDYIIELQDQQ